MKKILIIILFILLNTNTFADQKLDKCYAEEQQKKSDLINYLSKLF